MSDDFEPAHHLRRFPAEWEEHDCVMLAWPHEHTDWNYMLGEARDCFARVVRAIAREECVLLVGPAEICLPSVDSYGFPADRVRFVDVPTNDTWARDFGGISVEVDGSLRVLDFKFNGWGLKFASNHDNLVNSRIAVSSGSGQGVFNVLLENRLDFVLEGGSIESDGNGTLLTTSECLMSPNRNGGYTREQIGGYLCDAFGAERVLWLDHGALAGDDTDSHIDTLARMAPGDTILYVGPGAQHDPNNDSLVRMRKQLLTLRTSSGMPYNLVELPLPDPIYDEDGLQLPATYANFLIMPHSILLPVYDQPKKDLLAQQILRIAFPDHEVVPVDCRALIRQHGSLHCVTMQFPVGAVRGIENGRWI